LPEGQDSTRNSSGPQSTNAIFQYNNANVTYDQANFDPARYKNLGDKKYSTTPSSDAKNSKNGRKKVSTLDDYLNKVKGLIELILTDNCYGISLQKLYKELSNKLSFDFDWRLFNCNDFYDFLITYAENLLDIEIKRNCLIIYPKNFRFGPQSNLTFKYFLSLTFNTSLGKCDKYRTTKNKYEDTTRILRSK